MTASRWPGIALIVVCSAAVAQPSDPVCTGNDSFDTCEAKARAAALVAGKITASKEISAEVSTNLLKRNTGDGNAVTDMTTSATEDFISRFIVSLASGGAGADDDQQAATFELNDFLGLRVDSGYKLSLRLNETELYAPLDMGLREANLSSEADNLAKQLGDFDDVTLGLSYSPVGKVFGGGRWGRDPDAYADVWEALTRDVYDEVATSQDQFIKLETRVGQLAQRFGIQDDQAPLRQQLANETDRNDFIASVTDAARAWVDYRSDFDQALGNVGFFKFSSLIDNQPQLDLKLDYTANDDLGGPDEFSLKLAYEHGIYNVNRLLKTCNIEDAGFSGCFRKFVADNAGAIDTGNRLTVSLEFQRTQGYRFDLPTQGIDLNIAEDESLIFGLTWGRYVGAIRDGRSRVEVQMAYEDVDSDSARQDRGIATAVLSHTLTSGVHGSVSLVYATKPEFRGDVDKELSARLGVNYKLGSVQEQ